MSRPIWFVRMIQRAFPSRFRIAQWTQQYPFFRKIVDHFLFRGDDILYLPKDNVIQIHEPIQQPEQTVLPSNVVGHFIDQANHLYIMNTCFCREADDCQDYPIDLGCLFMGEAVHQINPKLGHLATREEAHAHVRRAREAGLVHMIGRNRIDNVWMGVGPSGKLLTVCNCCPCCCLWKVLPDLPQEIGGNVTQMPGVSVTVTDACVGCGRCTQDVCFVDAIEVMDGRAVISEACRGCGRCVEVCPHQAITLTIEDTAYVRTSIDHLAPLADLR
jgi:ferredoxin